MLKPKKDGLGPNARKRFFQLQLTKEGIVSQGGGEFLVIRGRPSSRDWGIFYKGREHERQGFLGLVDCGKEVPLYHKSSEGP